MSAAIQLVLGPVHISCSRLQRVHLADPLQCSLTAADYPCQLNSPVDCHSYPLPLRALQAMPTGNETKGPVIPRKPGKPSS